MSPGLQLALLLAASRFERGRFASVPAYMRARAELVALNLLGIEAQHGLAAPFYLELDAGGFFREPRSTLCDDRRPSGVE